MYTLKKLKGRRKKIGLFQGWVPMEGGGHKERGNEGEYVGCILYSYKKIEERNLLELF
jgi:hypothetical protein